MDLILHEYYLPALASLSDSQFRKMVLAMMEYAKTGVVSKFDDPSLSFGFEMIRGQIDSERGKHEARLEACRHNGKKGGRPKKNQGEEKNQKKPIGFSENQKNLLVFEEGKNSQKKPIGFSENPLVFSEHPETPVNSGDSTKSQDIEKNQLVFSENQTKPIGFSEEKVDDTIIKNKDINLNSNILSNSYLTTTTTTSSSCCSEKTKQNQLVFDDEWERVKQDVMWRSQVCMTHEIQMADLDKILKRFEGEIEIKGIHVERMRRYFGSWIVSNRNILNENNLKTKQNGNIRNNRLESGMLNKEYNIWGNKKPVE